MVLIAYALGGFGEVEQTVETDGRRKQGRKIYSAHSQILLGAKWLQAAPDTTDARLKRRDPDGIPIASWRRRKKLEARNKFQGAGRQNFSRQESRWLIGRCRACS